MSSESPPTPTEPLPPPSPGLSGGALAPTPTEPLPPPSPGLSGGALAPTPTEPLPPPSPGLSGGALARTPTEPLPPPSPGLSGGALAGLIVGVAAGTIILLIGVIFYKRKKRKEAESRLGGPLPSQVPKDEPPSTSNSSGPEQKPFKSRSPRTLRISQVSFTCEELATASDGFSDANFLGQGGFGYVHKGVLSDGRVVAIKQLKAGSGQGEREFQAEIQIISRVHHRHLVSLFGYCITEGQKMLVYEFVPNNSLEFHLHGKGRPTMNWSTRMKIAIGSARGLSYLHEDCKPKIIHRDIKAANILLDDDFEAKLADFGLAKYLMDYETHVSTRVMGTLGYLAPEFASSGKLTEKSDVFSFGVVLLELITGLQPVDKNESFLDDSIVDWASPLLKRALEERIYDPLVDPKLQGCNSNELTRMMACAAACIRHSARLRPRMSQVVRALEGNLPLDDLRDGITQGRSTALDYNSTQYREGMKKLRKMALESQETGSSDCSGLTSMHPSGSTSSEGQQTTRDGISEKVIMRFTM